MPLTAASAFAFLGGGVFREQRGGSSGGSPSDATAAVVTAPAPAAAALGAGQAQDDQQDHGTDDGPDDPRGVELVDRQGVVLNQRIDEPANERPDNTQDDGAQYADGIAAGNQQAGDETRDESDDQQDDNESYHGRFSYPSTVKYAIDLEVTVRGLSLVCPVMAGGVDDAGAGGDGAGASGGTALQMPPLGSSGPALRRLARLREVR